MIHCFTGGHELARRALALGFYISFSGIVAFPRAEMIQDVARAVPLDRLLIETDSPFLAPPPHRGKRNEPAFVVEVARKLAALRGASPARDRRGHARQLPEALPALELTPAGRPANAPSRRCEPSSRHTRDWRSGGLTSAGESVTLGGHRSTIAQAAIYRKLKRQGTLAESFVRRREQRGPAGGQERDRPGHEGDHHPLRPQGHELRHRAHGRGDPLTLRRRVQAQGGPRRARGAPGQAQRAAEGPDLRRVEKALGRHRAPEGHRCRRASRRRRRARSSRSSRAAKLKVQAAIQGDQVRVTGKNKDDLQSVIQLLKETDLGIDMQFTNYR